MHISSLSTIAFLIATATAWRAGLWTTDGRNLQVHGTADACNTISAIPVDEVTFDPATDYAPDPTKICLYSDVSCKAGTSRGCFGKHLTGYPLPNPGTVKSYWVL